MIKILREEKGTTVVLVALMATVFLGMAALVVDYGLLTVEKERLQNKCDAASLAGSQELPASPNLAIEKAKEYAGKNGLDLSNTTITVSDDKKSVIVSSYKSLPLSFARALDIYSSSISAQSKAQVAAVGKVMGAIPLGIADQPLSFGQKVALKVAPDNTEDTLLGSGNYGILALTGPGASNYENDLKYGYQAWLKVGDIIPTQTGNISGKTQTGVNYRILQCNHVPKCTPTAFADDCPRLVYVPVYVPNEISSNQVKNVRIVGFAAFFLDSYTSSGKDNFVYGYFVRKILPGEVLSSANDYGVDTVRLTK